MNKQERYDRMFDVLLNAAAEEEFQQELDAMPSEEELKKEYTPSPELGQKIRRMAKEEYCKTLRRKAAHIAKKVAVIIAIVIPIALGSLLSVKASRNAIFNAVLEWKADHVDIYFQNTDSSSLEQDLSSNEILLKPQYIPYGFSKSKEAKIDTLYETIYKNKENVSITFDQVPLSKAGKTMVDSKHTVYKEILINGQKASLFAAKSKNDKTFIVWKNSKISLMLCSTINQDELIKMAESIIIEKN